MSSEYKKLRDPNYIMGSELLTHTDVQMIPIVSIVGKSDSGKTTLIEKLVRN